ncbi:hypothetical protein [Streptomyces halobius]|uniref:Uncharacterized protein n=1 Tax=Streptomyces halobius TaxID=2879846 RepID=A0ABY4M722_9ACTN|nr:hypothetical protein [Streptomyces halobius]UQA93552.1 hypothetical protein K9S39_18350 [Streptomyces halobius]
MTQSGQGHDPQNSAAGPAREGIVLPANGEPWVPDQQAAPPAGQPWGQPWGPGQQDAPSYGEPPAQGQPPAQQQPYGQAPLQSASIQQSAPVQQAPLQQAPDPMAQQPLPPQGEAFPSPQGQPPMPPMPPAAMPQQQASPALPSTTPAPSGALPPEGQSYGGGQQNFGQPQQQPQSHNSAQQQPQPYAQQPQQQSYTQQPQQAHPPQATGAQQPPSAQQPPTGHLIPATPQAAAPLPPEGDAEKTALISPMGAQQSAPGAAPLPPEAAARPETPGESTQLLRRIKPPQGQPLPQAQPMPAPGPDSEATQLIPPVGAGAPTPPPGAPYGIRPGTPGDRPTGDRATPAEFEGLFRDEPAAPGAPAAAPDSTAQLPRFEEPGRAPYGQQFPPQSGYDQQSYDDDRGGRRRLAPAVITGAIVVALAGAGLGVGWALSGGSDDDSPKKENAVADSEKAADEKPQSEPSADPAEAQAKELDTLLGDSNNSRASVISAVTSIKTCDNLGAAAKDLREAAAQRSELVSRLKQLQVDKIPNNAQLAAALTKAWQSSASADNHYAAWAGQVGGKKGCHKGKARPTQQTARGHAASGQATKAKRQAAQIWNPIARKYGLTERRPEQL